MEAWTKVNSILIAGNEPWRILALFASLLVGAVAGLVVQVGLTRSAGRLERMNRDASSIALRALAKITLLSGVIVGLEIGSAFLTLTEETGAALSTVLSILIALTAGFAVYNLVDVVDQWLARIMRGDPAAATGVVRPVVRASLRITVVLLALLQIAQILTDKPLTSIVAGLGIGGLAIALAAQETVKNFFGSLVIFADKPFLFGERILVDSADGVVEEVGLRSTRIRTLDGHLVTLPNGELANKAIQNIGRRPYIRRVFNIGLPLNTSPDQVRRAIAILHELLEDHEGMRVTHPPRVAFNDITTTALNILVIYWYFPGDFWALQAFNERFNLELLERFNAAGIRFALPAQTIHLAGEPPN